MKKKKVIKSLIAISCIPLFFSACGQSSTENAPVSSEYSSMEMKDEILQEIIPDVIDKGIKEDMEHVEQEHDNKSEAEVDAIPQFENGLTNYKGKLCYFRDGKVDVTYTGLAEYENQTWYVSGGLVDKEYSGLLESEGKQWSIENGLVIDKYSGILQENGTLYVYREGNWAEQFTGIVEYEGNNWYVRSGILDKNFCGLVLVDNALWEVNNGELQNLFSGVRTWEEKTAYYVNGVIDASFTGIADGQDGKWYVVNGIVDKDYMGIFCSENQGNSIVINGKVSSSFTKDELIRTYYAEREAIWLQMKYVMLQALGDMQYIHFDEDVESVDVVGMVIDGLGWNSVASESLKQAIQSATSGETIEDIVNSAIEGAVSGGKSYVEETLKENISTYFLGFNIFKTIGTFNQMNDLFNPDDTPVIMANALIDDQERDIEALLELINDDVVDIEKVYQVVSLSQCILERENMLSNVLDKTCITNSDDIIKSLRIMEQSYGIWNQCIIEASNMEWEASVQLSIDDVKTFVGLLRTQVQEDQALYDFAFESLILEYDTEGFAYETAVGNSASTFLGMTAGSLWGKLMKSDQQQLVIAVQEGHRDYFRKLCSYQEQSYEELLKAKVEFDKVYGYYASLCKDGFDDTLLKYYDVIENIGETVPWEEERKQLLDCIAAYKYDMECIDDFYQCILSDGNQDYLTKLSTYTSNLEILLEGREGVTSENDEQIYLTREKDYVAFMLQCLEWRNVPMFDEISQYTVYGVGYRTLYKSRDLITIISQSSTLTNRDRIIRMYDRDGFPIYIKTPECEVFYRDGEPIEYSCNEGHAKSLYGNAVTVLEECKAH